MRALCRPGLGLAIAISFVCVLSTESNAQFLDFLNKFGKSADKFFEKFGPKDDRSHVNSALNRLIVQPGQREINWHNPHNERNGIVKLVSKFSVSGTGICWKYARTLVSNEQLINFEGDVCREVVRELEQERIEWRVIREEQVGQTQVARRSAVKNEVPPPIQKFQKAQKPEKPVPSRAIIRETQSLLHRLGFNPGPADGLSGRKTRQAIRNFQRSKGLNVNGKPSTGLINRMNLEIAEMDSPSLRSNVDNSRFSPSKPQAKTNRFTPLQKTLDANSARQSKASDLDQASDASPKFTLKLPSYQAKKTARRRGINSGSGADKSVEKSGAFDLDQTPAAPGPARFQSATNKSVKKSGAFDLDQTPSALPPARSSSGSVGTGRTPNVRAEIPQNAELPKPPTLSSARPVPNISEPKRAFDLDGPLKSPPAQSPVLRSFDLDQTSKSSSAGLSGSPTSSAKALANRSLKAAKPQNQLNISGKMSNGKPVVGAGSIDQDTVKEMPPLIVATTSETKQTEKRTNCLAPMKRGDYCPATQIGPSASPTSKELFDSFNSQCVAHGNCYTLAARKSVERIQQIAKEQGVAGRGSYMKSLELEISRQTVSCNAALRRTLKKICKERSKAEKSVDAAISIFSECSQKAEDYAGTIQNLAKKDLDRNLSKTEVCLRR